MHVSRLTQIFLAGWVLFCVWTLAGLRSYHSVPMTLVERRGSYEVRSVPAHVVARIDVSLPWDEARSAYEAVLRSYMAPIDARVALVRELKGSDATALWTALPVQYDGGSAPRPQDPIIRLVDMPERRMAVVSLMGWVDQDRLEDIERGLRNQLTEDRYVPFGSTRLVEYSPAWAPGFVRRSEVMISIH